jgi:DnaJ-class molecular chaperone
VRTYFRLDPAGADPERLLNPEHQTSEPWSGTIYGRCDKCGGDGETIHECESCRSGADPNCPACGGAVRYRDECPACGGSGQIDDSSRDGVSVFPDEEGLYRYMLRRRADLDGCVVLEIEGNESRDQDFDADEGALLVHPSRIADRRPLDQRLLERVREELAG